MDSWKEIPEIFIGFDVYSHKTDSVFKLRGKDIDEEAYWKWSLVARKIENMTNEEVSKFPDLEKYTHPNLGFEKFWIKRIIRRANSGTLEEMEVLYLLSIKVYPLPQSHFKQTELIEL